MRTTENLLNIKIQNHYSNDIRILNYCQVEEEKKKIIREKGENLRKSSSSFFA